VLKNRVRWKRADQNMASYMLKQRGKIYQGRPLVIRIMPIILLMPTSFKFFQLILRFMSNQELVGSNPLRLYYRYRDLRLLDKEGFIGSKILELGTGSSTIYFLNRRKTLSLHSLEESRDFLLKGLSEQSFFKFKIEIVKAVKQDYKSISGTRYDFKILGDFDFVYIDGPVCLNDKNGLSLPNLDLLSGVNYLNSVIAIDARISTVLLLSEHYRESHFLIESRVYQSNFGKISKIIEEEYKLTVTSPIKKVSKILTIRTCVLVPNALALSYKN